MRVKMLRLMCHPTLGNVHPEQEVDLPDDEAEKRIAAGYCMPVGERSARRGDDGQEPKKETPDNGPTVKPVDKMTVPELQAYAAEHGIDLGDATLKRDILAAIEAAQDEDGDATQDED